MEKDIPLQRTCTACGLTKPLSAFLFISSTRGTTYGSLCSTCRGTEMERRKLALGDEESGSATARLRIGAEEKLHFEQEWARKLQEKDQEAREQKKKEEQIKTDKIEDELSHEGEKRLHSQGAAEPRSDKKSKQAPPSKSGSAINPALLNPEKDREVFLKQQKEKDLKENRLGGALTNIDSQHSTVARQNIVGFGFLTMLGKSAAANTEKTKRQHASSQEFFPGAKRGKTTVTPENTPENTPEGKSPGLMKKK